MKIGLNTPQDYLAMAVRRRWWIIVPFIALAGISTVTVLVLPETYVSEALVLVRPREIPEEMVPSLLSTSTQNRLTTIENTLRSRRNLREVLEQFGDRIPEMQGLSDDRRVEQLNEQIEIEFQFEQTRSDSPLTSFRLRYQNNDPELAQAIAQTLTDIFIREDNEMRSLQTTGTTDFFRDEVAEVEARLAAVDEERRRLLQANLSTLPEQQAMIVSELERLTNEKLGIAEREDRYSAMLIDVDRQISQTPETIPAEGYVVGGVERAPDPRIAEYRALKLQFDLAASQYTERNPNYRRAEQALRTFEAALPPEILALALAEDGEAPEDTGPPMVENPEYANLMETRTEIARELEVLAAELERLDEREAAFEARLSAMPATEQLIADVNRRHEALQEQYDELQSLARDAQLSANLESEQRGAMFEIVDRANLPLEPSRPNKRALLLVAILGSLAIAVALAAGVDIARQRVWTQADVEQYWGVPVLVDIPEIVTDADVTVQRRRRLTWGVSAVGAAFAYGFVLYAYYLNHDPVLQVLNPFIQQIVYR